jgi:hypothetical protein
MSGRVVVGTQWIGVRTKNRRATKLDWSECVGCVLNKELK